MAVQQITGKRITKYDTSNPNFKEAPKPEVEVSGNVGDDEDVYEGEYENEDLPENNEEKAKKIKDFVKEAGEVVYDVQEDISEGNYLKLMDLLQKITNEVNSL